MSAQIAQLERALGVVLFERSRARVLPTPAGVAFLVRAREVLERAEQLDIPVFIDCAFFGISRGLDLRLLPVHLALRPDRERDAGSVRLRLDVVDRAHGGTVHAEAGVRVDLGARLGGAADDGEVERLLAGRLAGDLDRSLGPAALTTLGALPWLLFFWACARLLGLAGPPNLHPGPVPLAQLLVAAVFCTGLATVAWNVGVNRLGIQTGGMWQNTVPVFAVLLLTVLVAGWSIRQEFGHQTQQARERLASLAELRATQLEGWLTQWRSQAGFLRTSQPLAEQFLAFSEGGDQAAGAQLLARMVQFRQASNADGVLLVSADGRVRQRLVLADGDVREPAWGPFRQR